MIYDQMMGAMTVSRSAAAESGFSAEGSIWEQQPSASTTPKSDEQLEVVKMQYRLPQEAPSAERSTNEGPKKT